jgi:hypothetical protein
MNFDIENLSIPYVPGLAQRGYADMIEDEISKIASKTNFGGDWKYFKARSKRSVEDFSIRDGKKSIWYDVKTHDLNGEFCMPNLISIDRCRKVLSDPDQDLIYIYVKYRIDGASVVIENIEFIPVYEIAFSSLAIQNLGLGVLQIKNAHKVLDKYTKGRYNWLKEFSGMVVQFYDKQAKKFEQLKGKWA